MIEIKGSVLNDSINAVKNHFGDKAYATIVGLLTEETRKFFEGTTILATKWYSLDTFVEFLGTDIKVTAAGNEQELIRRSEALIEQQLKGIYKVFVKLGSPQFVLDRISSIHRTYFRGVDISITFPGTGKAILKYTGFSKKQRLIGFTIIGFYRKALEISGAKNVDAKFTTSIEEDKGYCELMLNWSGK